MQVRYSDCDVNKLKDLRKSCLIKGEKLTLLMDRDSFVARANIENPDLKHVRVSSDYIRIPDVILYVSPTGRFSVLKEI